MEVKVQLNNLRVAPRKSRQVIDLIRGKNVVDARALLEFTIKRTAEPLLKLLNSAIASAERNHQVKDSDLYIATVTVDEGPTLKRMQPESRGRGFPIMKRTSHITIILKEINPVVKKSAKAKKEEAITKAEKPEKEEKKEAKKKVTKKVKKTT